MNEIGLVVPGWTEEATLIHYPAPDNPDRNRRIAAEGTLEHVTAFLLERRPSERVRFGLFFPNRQAAPYQIAAHDYDQLLALYRNRDKMQET